MNNFWIESGVDFIDRFAEIVEVYSEFVEFDLVVSIGTVGSRNECEAVECIFARMQQKRCYGDVR